MAEKGQTIRLNLIKLQQISHTHRYQFPELIKINEVFPGNILSMLKNVKKNFLDLNRPQNKLVSSLKHTFFCTPLHSILKSKTPQGIEPCPHRGLLLFCCGCNKGKSKTWRNKPKTLFPQHLAAILFYHHIGIYLSQEALWPRRNATKALLLLII